jgi:Fur family ferric uptake transcriptional regulator
VSVVGDESVRRILADAGLRVTGIRVAVYAMLRDAGAPVSHREAVERLGAVDRVSVFRNLVALSDAGLVRRLELGDHTWRFELVAPVAEHQHAHFTCVSCGEVTCLEDVEIALRSSGDPRRVALLERAEVQLRGVCDECR